MLHFLKTSSSSKSLFHSVNIEILSYLNAYKFMINAKIITLVIIATINRSDFSLQCPLSIVNILLMQL